MKTRDAARGCWTTILSGFGIDRKFLLNKNGPCPMCGGKDRFRFDNDKGNGTYFCNGCGAGDGLQLVMAFKGWDFTTAASEVDKVVGNAAKDPRPRKKLDDEGQRRLLRKQYDASRPVAEGDPVHAYLTGRVALPRTLPKCLRFDPNCRALDGSRHPAMLAVVEDPEGNATTIHRTYLGPNGKADIDTPRALMPGEIGDGSAVRLFPVHGDRLGIAEGIETAFAAAARFSVPVWAALNAGQLAKWQPPSNVRRVIVFGDCDEKFGGQAAAYSLAHRLATKLNLDVEVKIPDTFGCDWADREAG